MLLLVTLALVVASAVLLILGFVKDALGYIYLSMLCAGVAALALFVFARLAKRRTASGAGAGIAADATAGSPYMAGIDDRGGDTTAVPSGRATGLDEQEGAVPASGFAGASRARKGEGPAAVRIPEPPAVVPFVPAAPVPAGVPASFGESGPGEPWAGDDRDGDWGDEIVFPIEDYDELRVAEVLPLLSQLDPDELQEVRDRELAGKARGTILARIDDRLGRSAPGAGSRRPVDAGRGAGLAGAGLARAEVPVTPQASTMPATLPTPSTSAISPTEETLVLPVEQAAPGAPAVPGPSGGDPSAAGAPAKPRRGRAAPAARQGGGASTAGRKPAKAAGRVSGSSPSRRPSGRAAAVAAAAAAGASAPVAGAAPTPDPAPAAPAPAEPNPSPAAPAPAEPNPAPADPTPTPALAAPAPADPTPTPALAAPAPADPTPAPALATPAPAPATPTPAPVPADPNSAPVKKAAARKATTAKAAPAVAGTAVGARKMARKAAAPPEAELTADAPPPPAKKAAPRKATAKATPPAVTPAKRVTKKAP